MADIAEQIERLADTVGGLWPEGRKAKAELVKRADEWRKSNDQYQHPRR